MATYLLWREVCGRHRTYRRRRRDPTRGARQIGWSCLVGLFVLALLIPIQVRAAPIPEAHRALLARYPQTMFARRFGAIRKRTLAYTDQASAPAEEAAAEYRPPSPRAARQDRQRDPGGLRRYEAVRLGGVA